jgi:hypothetical protein
MAKAMTLEAELEQCEGQLREQRRLMENAVTAEAAGGDGRTARAAYQKAALAAEETRTRIKMLKAVIAERDRDLVAERARRSRDHGLIHDAVRSALGGQRFLVLGRLPDELQDEAWTQYKAELAAFVARREAELASESGTPTAATKPWLAQARALLARPNADLIAESRERVRALVEA